MDGNSSIYIGYIPLVYHISVFLNNRHTSLCCYNLYNFFLSLSLFLSLFLSLSLILSLSFISGYRCNHKTGEWAHTTRLTRFPERKWLSHFSVLDIDPRSEQYKVTEEQGNIISDQLLILQTVPSSTPFSCMPKPSPAAVTIKQQWNVSTSRELLEKIKKDANDEVEKIEKALNPSKGNKNKKKSSSAVQPDGIEVALTAFEDVRWFMMANDADNLNNSDNGSVMILKGTKFLSS